MSEMSKDELINTVKVGVSEGLKDAWKQINDNTGGIADNEKEIALLQKDADLSTTSQHEQGKRLGEVEQTTSRHTWYWRVLWGVATLLGGVLAWVGAKMVDALISG